MGECIQLTLVAGERRLPLYRHPTRQSGAARKRAMLVFCARGYGLYANLTRLSHLVRLGLSTELHHVREMKLKR